MYIQYQSLEEDFLYIKAKDVGQCILLMLFKMIKEADSSKIHSLLLGYFIIFYTGIELHVLLSKF